VALHHLQNSQTTSSDCITQITQDLSHTDAPRARARRRGVAARRGGGGGGGRARLCAWAGRPMSVMSPSGPTMQRVDVTTFSRSGSSGGLVTCAPGV